MSSANRTREQLLARNIWQQAAAEQVPALGLIVFRAGEQQLGVMCGAQVDAQTAMRFGSITKTFTGLTLLSLRREGKLKLQQPLSQLLAPGLFKNPWAQSAPLRVRHLLELSAGLPDLTPQEWNSAKPLTLSQALALDPGGRKLLWPPGLQHSYSNSTPGLSQVLIESVTGTDLEIAMGRRVFAPLGMTAATLTDKAPLPGGFRADGRTPIPYWHMTFPAFGALNANLPDMARALGWLIHQGCLWQGPACLYQPVVSARPTPLGFGATDRRALFEPQGTVAAQAGLMLGYGAGIYPRVRSSTLFYGHGGDADGYRSRYGFDPRTGNGYLVVINTDNAPLLRRLVQQLERALASPQTAPALAPLSDELALGGRYYPSSARFDSSGWANGESNTVQVRLAGDRLLFTQQGRTTALLPVVTSKPGSYAMFRRPADPVASVVFAKQQLPGSDKPALLLQGELGNYVQIEPGHCPPIFPFCDSQ